MHICSLYCYHNSSYDYTLIIHSVISHYSDSVGWSGQIRFKTPPAAGSEELRFLAYGDMGKAPLDESIEHYIQVSELPKYIVYVFNFFIHFNF